jgi:hypothetical protein
MKLPPPTVQKAIFQLRFKPELDFCERMVTAAKRLPAYVNWKRSANNVKLLDFRNHCSLNIESSSFAYTQDSGDVELEKSRIAQAVQELPEALAVKRFDRLGYRRFYLMPIQMPFEALVLVLKGKLFSQDEKLSQILPSKLVDFGFTQILEDAAFKYNLQVSAARKVEIPALLQPNVDDHFQPGEGLDKRIREVFDGYPDVAVFIDIDAWKQPGDLTPSEIDALATEARKKNQELAERLGQYMVETE